VKLELSEIFVCPLCRPERGLVQGLVVLVDEVEERRVRAGSLGCPECETRFPIRSGEIRFGEAARRSAPGGERAPDPSSEGRSGSSAEAGERAVRAAALSGVREGEGPILLDRGLADRAVRISELTGGAEVLALGPGPGEARPGATWLRGTDRGSLPFFSGRFAAVLVAGERGGAVGEFVRVLRGEGRLVVFAPDREIRTWLEERGLRVLASDERALVALRPGPGPRVAAPEERS